ncbi:MAG TPA: hypothetical protein VJP88_02970, partial [Caulobacteraceae bacterium]|nr:hypothetical protein [Caulobacteraceae bacterium]
AIRASLTGGPPFGPDVNVSDFVVFQRYGANFPWRSHAMWFLTQMIRWGQAPRDTDFAAAAAVYESDLFRQVAAELGARAPVIDLKIEGAHQAPWRLDEATGPIPMAADGFFDGLAFDPAEPLAYVDAFPVARPALA